MGKQYSSSSWIFQAKKKGIKDYHDNMDSHMFIAWVTDRLLPSFRKMYWTGTHKPKMILVLDNAPYHHKGKEGCIAIAGLNKFRPSEKQIAAGDDRTLLSVALEYDIDSLTIRRDGELVQILREELHMRGKISADELRAALSSWFRIHHPDLLQTELESISEHYDFDLIFTPPYCPKFQPIELLWRDSKNFVAREWYLTRNPKQTANDLMDFWFGTDSSNKRKKNQQAFGPIQMIGYLAEVRGAINEWVAKAGLRLSGELGDLEYDHTRQYPDDGSLIIDDTALEIDVESDVDEIPE